MDKILQFQKSILNDPAARKALAANPKEYLKSRGIDMPAGTTLPDSIPLDKIEKRVTETKDRLTQRGVTVDFDKTDLNQSQKVLSDVFKDELWGVSRAGAGPAILNKKGQVATIAVMAAVVVVVVA